MVIFAPPPCDARIQHSNRGPHKSLFALAAAASVALVTFVEPATAHAERAVVHGGYRVEAGEEHGSQVASSEWLPVFIGGATGLVLGGLIGASADSTQPPVAGPLVGAAIGAFTGGAGGSWFIRSTRHLDTRLAATLTGIGMGGGVAAFLFAKTDSTAGKVSALALLPTMGAFAGYRLAIVWGGKQKRFEAAPGVAFEPTAAPIYTPGVGATGFALGVNGIVF